MHLTGRTVYNTLAYHIRDQFKNNAYICTLIVMYKVDKLKLWIITKSPVVDEVYTRVFNIAFTLLYQQIGQLNIDCQYTGARAMDGRSQILLSMANSAAINLDKVYLDIDSVYMLNNCEA